MEGAHLPPPPARRVAGARTQKHKRRPSVEIYPVVSPATKRTPSPVQWVALLTSNSPLASDLRICFLT
jgi:hypothetical protein